MAAPRLPMKSILETIARVGSIEAITQVSISIRARRLRSLIISPPEKSRLAQLLIGGDFGEFNLANELRLDPLDLFFDLRRVIEW